MTLKTVFRYSPPEGLLRLVRVMGVHGHVGDGHGYSWKLSLGLQWRFPFVRIRYARSYGGFYV